MAAFILFWHMVWAPSRARPTEHPGPPRHRAHPSAPVREPVLGRCKTAPSRPAAHQKLRRSRSAWFIKGTLPLHASLKSIKKR